MQSETIGKLAEAMAKAQSEYLPLIKNCVNPYFKSEYADLSACIDATKPALKNNNLAIIQATKIIDGHNALETKLIHSSGEWISGEYLLSPVKNDPQSLGSSMTYARRYTLCGILNISADPDDDANVAQGIIQQKSAPQKQYNTPSKSDLPF